MNIAKGKNFSYPFLFLFATAYLIYKVFMLNLAFRYATKTFDKKLRVN